MTIMETEEQIIKFQLESLQKEIDLLLKKLKKLREPRELEQFELIDCGQG